MSSFLGQLVDELYDKHKGDLSELCIVFPTRRAGLFFKKYLSAKIETPHWSPVIFSIQDFIRNLSSFVVPDQLALIFELFEVYQKYFPDEPFEKFYPWGEMLLKDFDEADRNLADTKQLFAYLKDEREINETFDLQEEDMERIRNFWMTFFNKEPGKLKNEFLENWRHLGSIYNDFRKRLVDKNQAYEGLAYRFVAENLKNVTVNYEHIVFAGFYALSKAEELIIEYLLDRKNADIYWDSDSYYYDDPKQEAGTFLRKNRLLKPGFKWKQNNFESLEKNVETIGVPLQVGQAKITGSIIQELIRGKKITADKIAVVLPDENMLFPVLYSLPEDLEAFNVTMGYPLSATPLFTLLESLVQLQINVRKTADGKVSFYHKHVMDILSHSSVQQVEADFIRKWIRNYQNELRWVRIPKEQLNNENVPLFFKKIFREINEGQDVFRYFKTILHFILESLKEREFRFHEIESEYIYHFYVQLQRLEDVVNQYTGYLSLNTFWNLYKEVIYSSKIPFSGEPLKGLQVMGFLETRLLDFENLFILSVNEDTLPASSSQASFIPYNIRKTFGLPTYEEQHAVSSYHFYRLIQRAKNIYLLYNTETKSITAGEKSRYLLQIEHELQKRFPEKIRLQAKVAVTQFAKTESKEIVIRKTAELMESLTKYVLKDEQFNEYSIRFSASALMTYINCPLKFYFQYIAKIREQEGTEENIEAATFGKILHRSMQLLYSEFNHLTGSVFENLQKKIPEAVDIAAREEFNGNSLLEGKNILLRHILIELIQKILHIDKKDAPLIIHSLEQKFFQPVKIDENKTVLLYGIIDRIDEVQGTTRIIDYKTGKVESGSMGSMDEIFSDPKFKEQFQTYFYSYLYWSKSGGNPVKAGILAVKNMAEGIRFLNRDEVISPEQFMIFETHLIRLISEILDPEKTFHQTKALERCKYCDYREICHRSE
jgi:CRISPR/Cas system-associated exonuclease Cas4 (RecB family)